MKAILMIDNKKIKVIDYVEMNESEMTKESTDFKQIVKEWNKKLDERLNNIITNFKSDDLLTNEPE